MIPSLLNGRYRIIQTLGTGGFGDTFLAEDTYMPSVRRCAIKLLKPVINNPQVYQMVQQRFAREAAVLEELGEENRQIPRLYAYFSEAGQFYLVQEWIEGETLTDKVQNSGLLNEVAVQEILVSILAVLDYVHSKHMVHRDIKPDNIIIRNRDGKPVLIDFGAVKKAMGNLAYTIAIGTPGFMPSEQAAGQPLYSSDLYSLALTAIFLLTGKKPQELSTDPFTGKIVWRQYAPHISPTLAAVLDRAIEPHPEDRFPTAAAMLDALPSGAVLPSASRFSLPPTVAVAPTSSQSVTATPTVPKPKPNLLLVGGSIAIGVGSAIALAVIATRSPSPPIASSSPLPTITPSEIASGSPSESPQPIPSPIISRSPSPLEEASPTPIIERSPIPSPTPTPIIERSPIPTPINDRNPNSATSVPAFPPGTPRSTVEAALGSPSRESRGLWRTRAVVYEFVPNKIDLGYLYDRNSQRIRQTEAAFAQSVDLQVMLTMLDSLLADKATENIKQELQRIYQRQSNSFTSNQGELKIQIVRQDCDFIYLSIWEADLHDFDVAGSQKCL
ncbi:MAG: protein kinase [Cyanosarcina radialis HA8281-LM2]|jgi:serine/threonine-protein kinase|nr:protein kinase [Cyanosarcina radialis HA8281-LM2]